MQKSLANVSPTKTAWWWVVMVDFSVDNADDWDMFLDVPHDDWTLRYVSSLPCRSNFRPCLTFARVQGLR